VKSVRVNVAPSIPIAAPRRAVAAVADYVALTKPRLNFLVVATSAAGYYLGVAATFDGTAMIAAVAGTALVAGGAAVLNQLYERDTDALMRRTRSRPLPAGRVIPADAAVFGSVLSAAGLALLAARTNWLAAASIALSIAAGGCGDASDPKAEAPPAARVQTVDDRNVFGFAFDNQLVATQGEAHRDETFEVLDVFVIRAVQRPDGIFW